jgi:hypothetical protein
MTQNEREIELVTPTQLARVLRTTPQSINRWKRQGVLVPVVSIGKVTRYNVAEAIQQLKAVGNGGRP